MRSGLGGVGRETGCTFIRDSVPVWTGEVVIGPHDLFKDLLIVVSVERRESTQPFEVRCLAMKVTHKREVTPYRIYVMTPIDQISTELS